jgi:hypothetical protein
MYFCTQISFGFSSAGPKKDATDNVSHYVPVDDCSCSGPQIPQPENRINFWRLDLKTELLKGARWAFEEFAERDKINVFYSIDIVDISKVDVDPLSSDR